MERLKTIFISVVLLLLAGYLAFLSYTTYRQHQLMWTFLAAEVVQVEDAEGKKINLTRADVLLLISQDAVKKKEQK